MGWLDEETRGEALKKAIAMQTHLGAPDDYVALRHVRGLLVLQCISSSIGGEHIL